MSDLFTRVKQVFSDVVQKAEAAVESVQANHEADAMVSQYFELRDQLLELQQGGWPQAAAARKVVDQMAALADEMGAKHPVLCQRAISDHMLRNMR